MSGVDVVPWPVLRAAVDDRDRAGLAALLGRPDVDGLTAVANDRWSVQRIDTALPPGRFWRELYPEPGRLWGPVVTAEPRTVHVLQAVAREHLPRDVLFSTTGRLAPDGTVVGARGLPGSIVRAFDLGVDGGSVEHVVVFAEDGLVSEIGGSRYRLGLFAHLALGPDGLVLDRPWVPGPAACALPQWLAVVDVPSTADVFMSVDGRDVPVQRRYVAAGPQATHDGPVPDWMCSFVADLSPARDGDPNRPRRLQVRMRGVGLDQYGGVHLAGVQHRRTTACTVLAAPRSQLLGRAVDSGGGGEVGKGLTLAQFVVANRERPAPRGMVYEPDVPYAPDRDRALVASVHRNPNRANPAPAVLFVHGGGWQEGDRGYHQRHAHELAALGYVTVNIEYRHHPAVTWRDTVGDVRAALYWLRAHSDELGADPGRIALAGGSAGAQLAAMAAVTDAAVADAAGRPALGIAALALLYPPVDLPAVFTAWGPAFSQFTADYFGDELAAASPISHVGPHWPPVLTLIGDTDQMIALGPVREFHAALDASGVPNRLVVYPGQSHGFDFFDNWWEPSERDLVGFLDAYLT